MALRVTLFTGQWADLPLAELVEKAQAFGYDGLELTIWTSIGPRPTPRTARRAAICSPSTVSGAGPSRITWPGTNRSTMAKIFTDH